MLNKLATLVASYTHESLYRILSKGWNGMLSLFSNLSRISCTRVPELVGGYQ